MIRYTSALLLIAVASWVFFTAAKVGRGDILDSTSLGRSLEVIRLENAHHLEEVRQAIRLCRQGEFKLALPTLEKYANEGDIGATFVLAKLHLDGLGVPKAIDKGTMLLKRTADGGHTPSMLVLGKLQEKSSPQEAIQMYKQAAALEDISAMLRLGYIFENGQLGTKQNHKLALNYYQKITKLGHPAGKFELARCHDKGIAMSPNAIQATRLYREAALGGYTKSQMMMARRYFEGIGLEQDPIAALGWLFMASQNGSTEAMVLLGQRYEQGDVIKQDLNVAGSLYSKAAKAGDPTGRYHLARLYLNGKGTKPDPVRAYVLLEQAQQLPAAKKLFEQVASQLTPDQLVLARQKIAEGKGK